MRDSRVGKSSEFRTPSTTTSTVSRGPSRVTRTIPRWRSFLKLRIKHFQVVKGKEVEVGKFERTKNIVVDRFMPKIEMDLWQVDSTYEVWADHTHGLYEIAKDLEARDEVGISKLSFGGFKESYALISSVREGDKFVITMSLSQKRKKYYHSMPFSNVADNDFKQEDNKVQGLLEEI